MKHAGYLIFLLVLLSASPLIAPGSADELYPTVTDVYFSQNGNPWNASVQFSVNCYGYLCKSWDCTRDPEDLAARRDGFTPELVFSYHATCPSYGCRIYEPYYHAERNLGTVCNLDGRTTGKTFTILNFSQSAIPRSCSDLHQFSFGGGRKNAYYNETPEYRRCRNESRRLFARCDQYRIPCNPEEHAVCEDSGEGTRLNKTPAYDACHDTYLRDRNDCDQYLQKINRSSMIMWKDESGEEDPAMRQCELRFEIPPEPSQPTASAVAGKTPDLDRPLSGPDSATRVVSRASDPGPVRAAYCSLLSFLGAKC